MNAARAIASRWKWPILVLMSILVLILALAAGLATYTFIKTQEIRRKYPPAGSFIELDDGLRMHFHYRAAGGAAKAAVKPLPTLVFIHGASGNAWDQMGAFLPYLEGKADLLFVDRPGLGYSDRGARHDDPMEQARSIGQLMARLEIDDAVIVGHSLGAAVTAALALECPDLVRGTVFLAPATHPWPGGVSWYYSLAAMPVVGEIFSWTLTLPVAEQVAPKSMMHVFSPEQAPENYNEMIRLPLLFRPASFRANARDVAGLKEHVSAQSARYPEIDQPSLVFTGDKDTVVWPSIHSDGLERDLPHVKKILLPGAGHMPHHTHGARISQAILDLAQRVERAEIEAAQSVAGE